MRLLVASLLPLLLLPLGVFVRRLLLLGGAGVVLIAVALDPQAALAVAELFDHTTSRHT